VQPPGAEELPRLEILSRSPAQTRRWGKRLGELVRGGEVIGLKGELGSGKTCFVRGLARGLEVAPEAWIRSPTFTLINEYHGRLPLYHVDLYRISQPAELAGLDLEEYLFGDGVCAVEWFDHLPPGEVEERLEVEFFHAGRAERRLVFSARGHYYRELLGRLAERRRKQRGASGE
jgi:tRNA threonylcarbamoyladenosine biosynthesis protein TsaE